MISTKQIGDGKLPNRYWVSISENYYIQQGDYLNWISEAIPDYKVGGETLVKLNTYTAARRWIDVHLTLGYKYEEIQVNCITIEDRISGEIYSHIQAFYPKEARVEDIEAVDTRFTAEKMAEAGQEFI
jgi:hypothetical protein